MKPFVKSGIDSMELPDHIQKIKAYFLELHEKVYKNNRLDCTTRSQLLYLFLKHFGYNPIVFRYFIKGEEKKNANKRKKITLIDGQKFPSHVVVLLDGYILDTIIPEIFTKEKYEELTSKISKSEIIGMEYERKIDCDLCKHYIIEYDLDNFKMVVK